LVVADDPRRAASRIVVHHPGSNHLAYNLVGGLQAEGYDAHLETGFFFDRDGALARLVARLPSSLRDRVLRELRRRSNAGVDASRLRIHPLPELAYVAAARAGITGERLAAIVGWRNERIDAHVAARVRRERPRAVIGHDGSALLAARAAREVGALAVLNQVIGHVEHGLGMFRDEAARSPSFAESLPSLPAWIVERHRAELAETDTIIVPSDYVRDTLAARGVAPERIAIVPYGVDVERFRPREAKRRDGKLRLLFVGHLSQRKGLADLLGAVKRFDGAGVELTLVGRMLCSEAALQPYSAHFRRLPSVPFDEVAVLFRDADVFVFPSLHEGSAFVTYEALASGLPVITTINAGSVVRDGVEGFIVPIRDIDALVERIERFRRDPDLVATMGEAARRRALDFTWSAYRARVASQLDAWLAPSS
jgi:glycosyltransferase involved in cell wall biosynthesis